MHEDSFVIGISGKIASGKTTLSQQLAETFICPRVGFGEYVRLIAAQRGLTVADRTVLQEIGQDLVEQNPEDFCRQVIKLANWENGPLVVEGIRHVNICEKLKEVVSPAQFVLIFVDTDENERQNRLNTRGDINGSLVEKHITENDVELLKTNADIIVNEETELYSLIEIIKLKIQHD
ncbi:AAA family ATPase [Paenibacillus sp. HW567]|uniref:AAA family ATPase n=1 Tax=Paenibacillus sp. HW567 TaxID=1034769 RepID=UPI0003692942|nr:AAA family ATPase [Paenibacillus sp. HW567]